MPVITPRLLNILLQSCCWHSLRIKSHTFALKYRSIAMHWDAFHEILIACEAQLLVSFLHCVHGLASLCLAILYEIDIATVTMEWCTH
jgi:hypothetical protein